jgi:hypothetical protein
LLDERERVDRWMGTLTPRQLNRYNHPSTVWRAYDCPNRGWRARLPDEVDETPDDDANDLPDDGESAKRWVANLPIRADKALGLADDIVRKRPDRPTEIDAESVEAVRHAADRWAEVVDEVMALADPPVRRRRAA